ncbi:WD40 repeat-like protein [Pleurotus eryngii]|uniref:WD repeat-containing protein JIP5 n=1 Tax=Pleurotus eryngii TaxID=5323 RepID=A0A9P6DFW9_PLEER|nr:WD40 repeat-like protein [Pleurotus eryngii]
MSLDISLPDHPFDLVFHPEKAVVFTCLLSGRVHAYAYDDYGNSKKLWSSRPFKKSCRCLDITIDGRTIWCGGKGKALAAIDTASGQVMDKRVGSHNASINRIKVITDHLFATGDDDGVIKIWDQRKSEPIRSYQHHFDYITDFLWLNSKKQLVTTSGDGTLSVVDVRSKQTKPVAHSEDQEDELLAIVPIIGETKFVVGTQLGILSIFNRSAGWGDCVDRVPGHPQSVDTLLALPAPFRNNKGSAILTGSSDGFIRAVEILPTKLLGVVADHGDFPVEKMALGRGGGQPLGDPVTVRSGLSTTSGASDGPEVERSHGTPTEHRWLGSIGYDDSLKLTDLGRFFAELDGKQAEELMGTSAPMGDDDGNAREEESPEVHTPTDEKVSNTDEDGNSDHGSGEEFASAPKKRKRPQKDPLIVKKKTGRNQLNVDGAFFAEL